MAAARSWGRLLRCAEADDGQLALRAAGAATVCAVPPLSARLRSARCRFALALHAGRARSA